MTEEVIKEAITSTPTSAAPKTEDHRVNSQLITDGNSAPPDHKRKEKPVPHYLRASTSSCHDNCKFGIQHSPEPKKHWPVRRAQLRRASTGNQDRGRVEIFLPQRARPSNKDQKLKISRVKDGNATATAPAVPELTNPKAPPESVPDYSESITCVEDLSAEASEPFVAGNVPNNAECFVISHDDVSDFGDGELSDGAVSIELEMPLAIQDSDASHEHIDHAILPSQDVREDGEKTPVDPVSEQSANHPASSEKSITRTVMACEKHTPETKSKSSANEDVKRKVKATSSVTRNNAWSQKTGRTSHPKAAAAAVEISSGLKIMRKMSDASDTTTKFSREKKSSPAVASAVPKVKEIKVSSPSIAVDSSAKPARLAKLKASTTKTASSSPSLSSGKRTDRKMTVKNIAKDAQVQQKKREEKVIIPRPLKLSRSVNMPAKSMSSVKARTIKKEKIAHPTKNSKKVFGTENSAANGKDVKEKILKTASPKVRKPDVNNKESRSRKEKPDTAAPRIRTTKGPKPVPIPSSKVAPPPRKLTFRRGTVLNPDDNGSNTTPRRLRFRPAATAAADAAVIRSRGGRITTGRRTGGGAASRDASAPQAEVVVLRRRRQDGKGEEKKRQEQGLLNNVIEETASRLVAEARTSKVRALVGAFETVISLQEGGKAAAPPPAAGGVAAP